MIVDMQTGTVAFNFPEIPNMVSSMPSIHKISGNDMIILYKKENMY